MKNERVALFVGFTPYHAHVAAQIIDSLDGEVFCSFSKVWPSPVRSYKRIGFLQGWPGLVRGVFSFIVFSYFVRRLVAGGIPVDVYIPHPGNIFSNFLFFSNFKGRRIYIYEDGLLNYYDAVVKNKFVGRSKRLLARVLGLRYQDYTGHLAGYDAGRYDGAFLSMPALAVRKECLGTLVRLNFLVRHVALKEKTVLFLDQNSAGVLAPDERDACVSAMLKVYPLEDYSYFYKAHHDHASNLADGMVILSSELQGLPAEMLIEHLRPSHVISFFSSALVNIKNSWPDIECVSIAASHVKITKDGAQCSLKEFFEGVGVKCF